jgi:hypothetical protein
MEPIERKKLRLLRPTNVLSLVIWIILGVVLVAPLVLPELQERWRVPHWVTAGLVLAFFLGVLVDVPAVLRESRKSQEHADSEVEALRQGQITIAQYSQRKDDRSKRSEGE